MTFTEALWAEARESGLAYALLTLVVTLVLSRAVPGVSHRRLPSSVWLFAIQLVLFIVTAGFVAVGSELAREARIAHRVLLAMAWVGTGGALVFSVFLARTRVQVPRILQDLIVGGVTLVVVLGVLHRVGVELGGLIATSAVVTAVIGLSLQDTLGNTIGGLALQTDGSVRVGDWVKVGDGANGRVVEIRWRYTAIETRNGETMLVPNSVLMKNTVTVLGRREGKNERYWRRWIKFNVDFRYAPMDVIEPVVQTLRGQPMERVADDPPPDCILFELHDSYATYAARYWLTDIRVDDPTDSVVRTRIYFALKRAEIPFSIPAHAVFLTEENRKRKEAKGELERMRRLRALKSVELFSMLEDDELHALGESLHPAPFSRGEIITRQDAEAHWLYLVIEGDVAVRVAKDGHDVEVARMGSGSFFGEMSLMTGQPRSATVVAITDVECYRLDRDAFEQLVKRRPEIAKPMAALLAERRANLERVHVGLDAEARARRLASDGEDLLGRMKSFLGLG